MALDVDSSRAIRGLEPLRSLVRAVVEADEHDENHAVEWKRTLDLTTKGGCFQVARAILGMANREPAQARVQFEGCGYVVIGAAPQNLSGVKTVDPADLSNLLTPYVRGARAPSWTPTFMSVDRKTVLVVTVEPPASGDPVWPLRREYGKYPKGEVFVRRHGQTAPADDAEIDMLSARASAASTKVPDLRVEPVGDVPLSWFDGERVSQEVDGWVRGQRDHLVAQAKAVERASDVSRSDAALSDADGYDMDAGHAGSAHLPAAAAFRLLQQPQAAIPGALARLSGLDLTIEPENRSLDEYIDEVDAWADRLREWAHDSLPARYIDAGHGALRIEVTNLSKRFLSDVEITVHFPQHDAAAVDEKPYTDAMPAPPRTFGEGRKRPGRFAAPLVPNVDYSAYPTVFPDSVSRRTWVEDGSIKIRIALGDLRPLDSDESDEVWVFLPSRPEGGRLHGEWILTARDLHDVVSADLVLDVNERPTDLIRCLTEASDGDSPENEPG